MRIPPALASCTAVAACLLAGAAPPAMAATRTVVYKGKTRHGDPISFSLTGSQITRVRAYVPTLCLATQGLPLSGTDAFDPPGSFPLGRTGQVTAKRHNAMWNTSDVTKHFALSTKRGPGAVITGKLHASFSFLMLLYTYPMSARPYVCTGDTTFRIMPAR